MCFRPVVSRGKNNVDIARGSWSVSSRDHRLGIHDIRAILIPGCHVNATRSFQTLQHPTSHRSCDYRRITLVQPDQKNAWPGAVETSAPSAIPQAVLVPGKAINASRIRSLRVLRSREELTQPPSRSTAYLITYPPRGHAGDK